MSVMPLDLELVHSADIEVIDIGRQTPPLRMLLREAAGVRRKVRARHGLQVKSRPVLLLLVGTFHNARVLVVLVACVVVTGAACVAAWEHDLSILQMPAMRS